MAGLAAAFGSGAATNAVSELEMSDAIFIIGSNTATAHPLVATRKALRAAIEQERFEDAARLRNTLDNLHEPKG